VLTVESASAGGRSGNSRERSGGTSCSAATAPAWRSHRSALAIQVNGDNLQAESG